MARHPDHDDEITLWQKVMATVRPLKGKKTLPIKEKRSEKSTPPQKQGFHKLAFVASPAGGEEKKGHRSKHQVPDGHWLRRLKSGDVAVEATLDLHGLTQTKAHEQLQRFIARARHKGHRTLLVITGKGGRSGGEGVLRQRVPHWLEAPPLSDTVMTYRAAHRKDGGDGALYVVLKR